MIPPQCHCSPTLPRPSHTQDLSPHRVPKPCSDADDLKTLPVRSALDADPCTYMACKMRWDYDQRLEIQI